MKTIGKLYHHYKQIEFQGFTYLEKTPKCLLHFYGHNDRIWSATYEHYRSENHAHPVTFLMKSGFKPVTDDMWELDDNESE